MSARIFVSARIFDVNEPVRHKVTGEHGIVVSYFEPGQAGVTEPAMVISVEDGAPLIVEGEATWEWESLLGPG